MVRTSLILPDPLHQRLVISAKQENKPVAVLIRETLDHALTTKENTRIRRMYNDLRALNGIGPKGVRDASATIDNVLYGENGAWKGSNDQ